MSGRYSLPAQGWPLIGVKAPNMALFKGFDELNEQNIRIIVITVVFEALSH